MLDNLINPDISGVTGYIRYTYNNSAEMIPELVLGISLIIFLIFIFVKLCRVIDGRQSKRYRELLSDMYVVGKIKQISTEDKIDLMDELRAFHSVVKKNRSFLKPIDEVVEMELTERISESNEDKTKPTKPINQKK